MGNTATQLENRTWTQRLSNRSSEPLRRALLGRWNTLGLSLDLKEDGQFAMDVNGSSYSGSYVVDQVKGGYQLSLFDRTGLHMLFGMPEIRRNALTLRPQGSERRIEISRAA